MLIAPIRTPPAISACKTPATQMVPGKNQLPSAYLREGQRMAGGVNHLNFYIDDDGNAVKVVENSTEARQTAQAYVAFSIALKEHELEHLFVPLIKSRKDDKGNLELVMPDLKAEGFEELNSLRDTVKYSDAYAVVTEHLKEIYDKTGYVITDRKPPNIFVKMNDGSQLEVRLIDFDHRYAHKVGKQIGDDEARRPGIIRLLVEDKPDATTNWLTQTIHYVLMSKEEREYIRAHYLGSDYCGILPERIRKDFKGDVNEFVDAMVHQYIDRMCQVQAAYKSYFEPLENLGEREFLLAFHANSSLSQRFLPEFVKRNLVRLFLPLRS